MHGVQRLLGRFVHAASSPPADPSQLALWTLQARAPRRTEHRARGDGARCWRDAGAGPRPGRLQEGGADAGRRPGRRGRSSVRGAHQRRQRASWGGPAGSRGDDGEAAAPRRWHISAARDERDPQQGAQQASPNPGPAGPRHTPRCPAIDGCHACHRAPRLWRQPARGRRAGRLCGRHLLEDAQQRLQRRPGARGEAGAGVRAAQGSRAAACANRTRTPHRPTLCPRSSAL